MKQYKKIIKLTESDIYRIVNSVLNEELNEKDIESRLFDFLDMESSKCRKLSSRVFNTTWIYDPDSAPRYYDPYAEIVIDEKYGVVIYNIWLLRHCQDYLQMDIDDDFFNKIILKWVFLRFQIPVNKAFSESTSLFGTRLKLPT